MNHNILELESTSHDHLLQLAHFISDKSKDGFATKISAANYPFFPPDTQSRALPTSSQERDGKMSCLRRSKLEDGINMLSFLSISRGGKWAARISLNILKISTKKKKFKNPVV